MKYISEYRDPTLVKLLSKKIYALGKQRWNIMEVCGGQTHSIVRSGLKQLLPSSIELIHGPGCPVCVTPIEIIDMAISIALMNNTILCSFGDMLRVPGSCLDLTRAKAMGADIRIILSPLEAITIAKQNPTKEVILFAIGFETTAPANGITVKMAYEQGMNNFSLLSSHVLVPPAIEYIMADPDSKIDGFLAAGHVCSITGYTEYHDLATKIHRPIVITGFEPIDIMQGLFFCIDMLEKKQIKVKNQYARVVSEAGNTYAKNVTSDVFTIVDREWRGIGTIPKSGLDLSSKYIQYNAAHRFDTPTISKLTSDQCISGQILQGKCKPLDCPHFGKKCTPQNPMGAPMVSTEGACSAYYLYSQKGSR